MIFIGDLSYGEGSYLIRMTSSDYTVIVMLGYVKTYTFNYPRFIGE